MIFAGYRKGCRNLVSALLGAVLIGASPLALAEENELKWTFKDGKLSVKNKDFSFALGGRLQMDLAVYSDDKADLSNGSEFRRGRLFFKGTLWKHWHYKFQYDFVPDSDKIKDAYLGYTGFGPYNFQVGHIKEPFSLEGLSSSKYILFMERPLPLIFSPGRNLGVTVMVAGPAWSGKIGLFQVLDDLGEGADEDDPFDVTGRASYAFMRSDRELIHLGASLMYRDIPSAASTRFRQRPESHVTDVRLIDTGSIDASDMFAFGLEAALVNKNLSLQAEYLSADLSADFYREVDDGVGASTRVPFGEDVRFSGYYLQGSWFLNPENGRNYSVRKGGVFGQVKPIGIAGKGGRGALELAARYSTLELDDGPVAGGKQDNFSLALNWYATPTIRFSANYIKVLSVEGGANDGDEPSIFQGRVQLEF